MTTKHHHYMQRALYLAELGKYTVSPNPMVGCVIVKNDIVISEGYHKKAGSPHAEINALNNAKQNVQNAVMYLTLEPCCHYGKTPPCVETLLKTSLKKIYVACLDPNPLVAGKGIELLRQAKFDVEIGLCEKEAATLNRFFFHYITKKKPFVITKWAISLDGKTVTHPEDDRYLSSEASLKDCHKLRSHVDAILIGSNTAIKDDPALTVRLKDGYKNHPLRIVVTSRGELPSHLRLFSNELPGKTIVATTESITASFKKFLEQKKIEFLIIPKTREGKVDLNALLEVLGKRNIISLLVEGGETIHNSFFEAGLANEVQVYLTPYVILNLKQKKYINISNFNKLAPDFHFVGNSGVSDV